jgi:hypothetical protein
MNKFELGQIVATPGAMAACSSAHLAACLKRHARGDWGVIHAEDKALNDKSVTGGARLMSAYPIDPGQPSAGFGENTLWIITEADRSATTFLLPDEY